MPCTSPAAPDACRPANLYGLSLITNAQSTTKNILNASRLSMSGSDDGLQKFPPAIMVAVAARKTNDFCGTRNACRPQSLHSKSFSLDTQGHIVSAAIKFRRSLDKRADC
jgi:hypothetical protein